MLAKRSRLDRGSVRAQQNLRRDIERVLHITGRMILRQVQTFEVVVVLLNLRSFFDRVAHAHERLHDLTKRLIQRMDMPFLLVTSRQRDIDRLTLDALLEALCLELSRFRCDDRLYIRADRIGQSPDDRTFCRREVLHGAEDRRQLALLSQEENFGILQRLLIACRMDLLLRLHLQFVQVFFHVGFQCVQLTFH